MRRALLVLLLLSLAAGGTATLLWLRSGEASAQVLTPGVAVLLLALVTLTSGNLFIRWLRWHYLTRRLIRSLPTRTSLKLYFSLWLTELAKRQGFSPDAEARDYLSGYDGDRWGAALAKHARGDLSFEALLKGTKGRGERAEAYFYEGLQRWGAGDIAEGKRLMQEVLKTKMMGFFEYDMALAYLRWGELPRAARAPASASARR